jgi:hypothetical protein
MIVIALCAILCGAESWVDVAEWGEDNESWLKKYLELAHGTASHDTFSRVFRLLDARVFEACFREWVMSLVGRHQGSRGDRRQDGTGVARRAEHGAAHDQRLRHDQRLCLAQEGVRGKGKGIESVKALLETLTLKGASSDGQEGSWTHRNTAGIVDHQPLLDGRATSETLAEAIERRHA